MDNASIHEAEDISKYIESRRYRCACLAPSSLELNPTMEFWSLVKSKAKDNDVSLTEVPREERIWALGGTVVWLHRHGSSTMASPRCFCWSASAAGVVVGPSLSLLVPSSLFRHW